MVDRFGNVLDINNGSFLCMDCMDGMREFPDKFFELAIDIPTYE